MLSITKNIFAFVDYRMDLVGQVIPATASPDGCGIIIPDMNAVEFSDERTSLPHAQEWLEQLSFKSWFLFVIDSGSGHDTLRTRYLGLKLTLGNGPEWATQIAASEVLSDPEGGIRYCGLVWLKPEQYGRALDFIGKHQRTAFLVADPSGGAEPAKLLGILQQEAVQSVLHSKKDPFIDWVRLMAAHGTSDKVFITSFGWAEEHCDFRYLVLGRRTALATLLDPDSPPQAPRG